MHFFGVSNDSFSVETEFFASRILLLALQMWTVPPLLHRFPGNVLTSSFLFMFVQVREPSDFGVSWLFCFFFLLSILLSPLLRWAVALSIFSALSFLLNPLISLIRISRCCLHSTIIFWVFLLGFRVGHLETLTWNITPPKAPEPGPPFGRPFVSHIILLVLKDYEYARVWRHIQEIKSCVLHQLLSFNMNARVSIEIKSYILHQLSILIHDAELRKLVIQR
jgi:hypothetical protein